MMMINILTILEKWGIKIPNEEWYLEYLKINKPDNLFFIDTLPFAIEEKNHYKFDQVDIFYQEVQEGKANKINFINKEMKYRNAITKLWLYNDTIVEIDISSIQNIERIDRNYKAYFKILKKIFEQECCKIIDNKIVLELLVQLGIRDIASISFYLVEFELLIVPLWSCFAIYFNDLTKIEKVKEIIFSEGLFLRENKQII